MKKVIFVCLLTLSVCLSDNAVDPGTPSKAGNETPSPKADTPAAASPSPPTPATDDKETKHQDPSVIPTQNTTGVTPAPGKNDTNATSNSADSKATTPTVKPAEHATPNTTAAPPNTTAAPPSTEKASTLKPTATTVQPHTLQARGFDGASFVGGIVLTLGLLAIGFMGFKYYKAQTERNYHTL